MHDILTIGIPVSAVMAGVLFDRHDTKELRGELQAFRVEVNGSFNKVEDHLRRIGTDLRQFYHLTGKLEARMDSLEKGR